MNSARIKIESLKLVESKNEIKDSVYDIKNIVKKG